MAPSSIVFIALIPLILWRIYSRVRRQMGRQKSKPWRHWTTIVFFPLLILLLGFGALSDPTAIAGLACGVAAGVALAFWGLRMTRFEPTPEGFFYTPNPYLGVSLSLLLVSRALYRFAIMYGTTGTMPRAAAQDFGRSPITLLIFGMLAGYYTAYAIGLLHSRYTHSQA